MSFPPALNAVTRAERHLNTVFQSMKHIEKEKSQQPLDPMKSASDAFGFLCTNPALMHSVCSLDPSTCLLPNDVGFARCLLSLVALMKHGLKINICDAHVNNAVASSFNFVCKKIGSADFHREKHTVLQDFFSCRVVQDKLKVVCPTIYRRGYFSLKTFMDGIIDRDVFTRGECHLPLSEVWKRIEICERVAVKEPETYLARQRKGAKLGQSWNSRSKVCMHTLLREFQLWPSFAPFLCLAK